jgi:3-hydroxy-3-methylglutaryl CoA synthase
MSHTILAGGSFWLTLRCTVLVGALMEEANNKEITAIITITETTCFHSIVAVIVLLLVLLSFFVLYCDIQKAVKSGTLEFESIKLALFLR